MKAIISPQTTKLELTLLIALLMLSIALGQPVVLSATAKMLLPIKQQQQPSAQVLKPPPLEPQHSATQHPLQAPTPWLLVEVP